MRYLKSAFRQEDKRILQKEKRKQQQGAGKASFFMWINGKNIQVSCTLEKYFSSFVPAEEKYSKKEAENKGKTRGIFQIL